MERESSICTPSEGLITGKEKLQPVHGRTNGPTRRSTKGNWTADEDEILCKAVERFKGKNWKKIAECFEGRTDVQCLHRWQKVLNPELVKGPWSKEEDKLIIELVNKYGPKKWSTIAQHLPGRIGKQCRERWHNHLNPTINKEAWTEEEELTLIRAHHIHGNKWAKLTQFLPGRTDNAIKNHWNSSVKKKLDSYIASGLLSQFPALNTTAVYQSQLAAFSTLTQGGGNDIVPKCGTGYKEIPECNQGSTRSVSSQLASDMILLGREDLQFLEESAIGDEPNTTPASTSSQYYTVEEVTLSIPDMDPDAAHSSDLQIQFSQGIETCSDTDYCNSDNLLDISLLELGKESSVVPFHDIGGQHGMDSDASYYTIPSGVLGIDSDQKNHILMSDGECFRTLFSDLIGPDSLAFCEQPYLSNQSVDIQIPASCVSISQPYDSSRSDLVAASGGQSSMPSTILSYNAEKINSGGKENQLLSAVGREGSVNPDDGIVFVNESANTLQDNCIELGSVEMLDLPKDEPKLIPVDTFGSSSGATQSCSKEDMKEDSGFLCYEPPRFLSLDIPLFSCDLIQSSNDMQMDYSPLGIRQLMTSSMNCFSPCRLWDSPTYDSSPEALLKNAAKTFRNTPSILRKRHREILSPLSDRRGISKKLGTNIISNFSQNISELDFLSDKAIDRPTTALLSDSNVDNKENLAIPFEARENMNDGTAVSSERNQVKDNERSGSEVKMDKGIDNNYLKCNLYAEADASTKAVQLSPRILLSFSSCQTSQKTVEALGATDGTSGNSCPPTSSPPPVSRSSGSTQKIASASRICLHTSSPLEILVNNASNDSLSVFGGTPFLRNIESPSAWKSPSFFNSFLPGPRIDTDITIEDIGYFISPGERSYDALGLMKHVSEHSASAFASAEEVLGNETPKQTTINVGNLDQQNKKSDQQTRTTTKASKALMERRTLDFSECVTPGKPKEKGKSSSIAMSFSSPSSYLLKGCR